MLERDCNICYNVGILNNDGTLTVKPETSIVYLPNAVEACEVENSRNSETRFAVVICRDSSVKPYKWELFDDSLALKSALEVKKFEGFSLETLTELKTGFERALANASDYRTGFLTPTLAAVTHLLALRTEERNHYMIYGEQD